MKTAYTQIGKLYRYGGSTPSTGFDCSGFTKWVFAQHGISLPRSSGDQLHAGKAVSRDNLRPGDLLIYKRYIGRRSGTHVGIYVGEGKFIHSPRTGHRIHVSDAFDAYRTKHFLGARRVLNDPDAQPLPAAEQQYLAEQALKRNKPAHEPPKLYENTFAESYTIYRVKPGDTISGLASRFHVRTRQLLAANQLNKRDVLQLNQRLMIPVKGGATGRIVKPGQARPEIANVVRHRVKSGETLGGLAQKYGVSSDQIAKANKLRSKHAIRKGQVLIIPGQRAEKSNQISQKQEAEDDVIIKEKSPRGKKTAGAVKKAGSNAPSEGILVASADVADDILIDAPAKKSSPKSYTVKSGDTIWDISKKFGLSESQLLAANNLGKKHTLRLGQQLTIPDKNSTKQQPAKKSGTTYVVQSGDTIWKIAQRQGIGEKELLAANKLSKKHVLRPGQKLVIP